MVLAKIEHGALIPIYADSGNSRGFYRILPGYSSYICLNENLLSGDEETHQLVYTTLLAYHFFIPEDSWERVFPHKRFFEELKRLPVITPKAPITFTFRRIPRSWGIPPNDGSFRTVGGKAG